VALSTALVAGLVGAAFAWIIDVGYKKSPEYKAEHPPKQKAVTGTETSAQSVTATTTRTAEVSTATTTPTKTRPKITNPPPPAIVNAPGGIPILDNKGIINNPTVNNFGPPPLPTPTIKICMTHPPAPEGRLYSTVLTLKTDVQITRPWFFFFFDGPVENGSVDMVTGSYGCNCPVRAEKMPNPERSFGFRTISINFGTNVWFPSDSAIRATIPSKQPVNLIKILSGGGDNPDIPLPENIKYECD
jgi:hypothetical protein